MNLIDELRQIGCHSNGDARCTCNVGQAAADEIERLTASEAALREQVRVLRGALEWYREKTRLARFVHSEGDEGRYALAADGGKKAAAALAATAPKEPGHG